MVKKAETEDLVKRLDKLAHKLDVVAAVFFTLIDVKGESESKKQHKCYFCYDHFLDSGWTSYRSIISFFNTIEECYHIECSLSFMRFVHCLLPLTEIDFQTSTSIGFGVIHENPSRVPEYIWPHVPNILSNTESSFI